MKKFLLNILKLYNARRTVETIIKARGLLLMKNKYTNPRESSQPVEDFQDQIIKLQDLFKNIDFIMHLGMYASHPEKKKVVHTVFFFLHEIRADINTIRLVKKYGCKVVVLVVQSNITAFARKEFIRGSKNQIFYYNELQSIVLNHVWILPHRLCSEEEKKEFMKTHYVTDIKQLPGITMVDPVVAFYNFRPGSLIEIERTTHTGDRALYYRIVTK